MKPPETVTLIDLEGKPIPLRENVPIHYFLGEYAHIVDFTWQFKDKDYRIYLGSSIKIGEATNHYDSLLPLILFINDQLTFIRNGMWETLAIYQATLGRYWEIPWLKTEGFEFVQDVVYRLLHKDGSFLIGTPYIDTTAPIFLLCDSNRNTFDNHIEFENVVAFKPISDSQEAWDAVAGVEVYKGVE